MAARRQSTTSERVLRTLIVLVLVAVGIVAGLLVSRTGRHQPTPSEAVLAATATSTTPPTTTTTVPATTTTTSVCDLSAPTDGCPLGSPAAIAWAQQQDQAQQAAAQVAQAEAVAQAEQAYAQCLNNNASAIAAQIGQTFGVIPATGASSWEPCSTAGLTPAQIQQVQQAEGPQPSTQSGG